MLPSPGVLCMPTEPPMAWVNRCTVYSPIPRPSPRSVAQCEWFPDHLLHILRDTGAGVLDPELDRVGVYLTIRVIPPLTV